MRRLLFLLFFGLHPIASYAQSNQTLLISTDTTFKAHDLLELLVNQQIPLVYSSSLIPNPIFNLSKGNYTISQLLILLKTEGIDVKKTGTNYILSYNPTKQSTAVNGYIRDSSTGESLIGAIVYVDSTHFTVTNEYGYFSLNLTDNRDSLFVQFIGYYPTGFLISENPRGQTYPLQSKINQLENITILSGGQREVVESPVPSFHRLDYDQKGEIPYFMGEVDVLQESLMLPGIKTLGEDASGLHVRGGNSDQNLILLDEAIIFNPNHFFGLISIFNPEAVNQVSIMKGFLPPSYGGRGSSVISIKQREGNYEHFAGAGGLGLISARLLLEGPIVKSKSSFLVSARQSIFDLSSAITDQNVLESSRNNFQDVNIKTNWRWSDKNTFYLSSYFGNDRSKTILEESNRWGNSTGTFRWNHLWNSKLFSNLSVIYSDYTYRVEDPVEAASYIGKSRIQNFNLKIDSEWTINSNSTLKFGSQYLYHSLAPGERLPFDTLSSTVPIVLDNESGFEHGTYLSHEWNVTTRLSLLYGVRLTGLVTYGPGTIYQFDPSTSWSAQAITDTLQFNSKEIIDQFLNPEPRIAVNYITGNHSSIKSAYSRSNQYLQLISATAIPSPTDIWKLSNRYLQPLQVDQWSTGFYYFNPTSKWQWTVETYYKKYLNLIEYQNGANLILNPVPETELLNAVGRSYGIEIAVRKELKTWSGWLSYSLSKTERRATTNDLSQQINNGNYFPDNHDKRHDITAVLKHSISPSWSISGAFYYNSGRPITFPVGKYELFNQLVTDYQDRNQNRISKYHRLDLSCRWSPVRPDQRWQHYWTLNVFNVYARKNAYTYFFQTSEENPGQTEVASYSIFGTIIPSVTYNFSF